MRTMIAAVSMIVVAAQPLAAQEHHLWIGLSGNRVVVDAVFRSVQDESVTVVRDGRVVILSLGEIEQVREIRGGLITRGAIVGASAGMVMGGMIGFLGAPPEDRNIRVGTTALAMGVVGGIIGSVIESVPEENEIQDLRGKTTAEKRKVFEEFSLRQ